MTLIAGKLPIVGLLDMLGGGHPHSSREQTMEVNKISANIRYSQDTGKGAWKVVELGAEATISDREHWKQAQ